MTTKLIHTSDWQIGKVFRFVDNATMGLLQEARLRTVIRFDEVAHEYDRDVPNFIAPDRAANAGLSYHALGDWHRQKKINERCWYSGTLDTHAFDEGREHD